MFRYCLFPRLIGRGFFPGLVGLASLAILGCSGGQMLKKGDQALEFTTKGDGSVRDVDGQKISLAGLRAEGPVMLVLLRGFS